MEKIENYAAFYSLLNRMHYSDKEELKESIVMEFTSGRTMSLREMTVCEYRSALKSMGKLAMPAFSETVQKVIKRKRSAVLHQMQITGINTADWRAVDGFCKDNRIAGKLFRELDARELDLLLVKLRAVKKKSNTLK